MSLTKLQKAELFIPPLAKQWASRIYCAKHFRPYKELIAQNTKFKGTHTSDRCFILGSGPSICSQDMKLLEGEVVFGMNNFFVHPDFKSLAQSKASTYYVLAAIHPPQTEQEWKEWFTKMEAEIPTDTTLFFGLDQKPINTKYILEKYGLFKNHTINWFYSGISFNDHYTYKPKHTDISRPLWFAKTVSVYALSIALYMGFKEIYLVGLDHNYLCIQQEKDFRFYKESAHQKDEVKRSMNNKSHKISLLKGTAQILEQYEILSAGSNSSIYNLSPTSLIDVFEFKDYNTLLNPANHDL